MKRSRLKRKSPLKTMGEHSKKMSALRRSTTRKKRPNPSWDAAWRLARADVKARSGGMCEGRVPRVCTARGEHVHHVILRSRGGPDEAWNLVHLCHPCHHWVHANPAAATELGLMRSRRAS